MMLKAGNALGPVLPASARERDRVLSFSAAGCAPASSHGFAAQTSPAGVNCDTKVGTDVGADTYYSYQWY